MANAKECDRCGKLYKGSIYEQSYFIRKVGSIDVTSMDICPECDDELVAWFEQGKATDEEVENEKLYAVKEPIWYCYDPSHSETLYKCPYCAGAIGSTDLRNQKGCGDYRCPHCHKLLDYKE